MGRLLAARPHGRIAIVVEDITRHSPVREILDVVLREIRYAGVEDDRIEIVFATGMHPPMDASEVDARLGPAAKLVRRRCNPCRDPSAHQFLGQIGRAAVRLDRGVASADLRIIVSSVSPHFQAGFGGGYRLLLPGCAPVETIRELNKLGIGREPRRLVGAEPDTNAMRTVIDAAGVLADQHHGRSFAIQYLLDPAGLPASIAAGEVIPTQRMLAKQCAAACGIVTGPLADVAITNAYPRDFDLSQSLKCMAHARWAVRPNGVIVCLTDTENSLRDASLPSWPIDPRWTRRLVRVFGAESVSSLAKRLAPGLALDAAPYMQLAAQILYRNEIVMYAPALHADGVSLPGVRIVGTIEDAIAAAERLLPSGPLRTVVFPDGGSTFPIPSPVVGGDEGT